MNEIERIGRDLLVQAGRYGASDIHFHPGLKKTAVEFRIDGELYSIHHISKATAEKLISHFKFLSGMDIGEKRRPQSGSLAIRTPERLNVRLSTLPTPHQESLVLRLLPQQKVNALEQLSLFSHPVNQLKRLVQLPYGLLLFTGATGSGKSTTMYALLQWLFDIKKKRIITIEDPIEKVNENFIQVEINEKAGITFEEGLRTSLRHDPDVLMIGEIRDRVTAGISIRAAMTGHLVLATLHTKDTAGALVRFQEFGVPLSHISETFVGIVTQQLVRTVCPYCKQACSRECLRRRRYRRLAIYEILAGNMLTECIASGRTAGLRKLEQERIKGIALGYIDSGAEGVR